MDSRTTSLLKRIIVAGVLMLTMSTSWAAPAIKTDPYHNDQTIIRQGLHPESGGPDGDEAILPRIVYPFLPSGNVFQNWGSKDMANAPDIGAVEAIIVFMAQAFSGKGSGGETGKALWKLAVALGILGYCLSGFLTFKAVTQGKKGPGEAIVAMLMKFIVCFMMIQMIAPNTPPMLIGLCNATTKGIDAWFAKGTTFGGPGGTTGANLLEATYLAKMAAGVGAAGVVANNIRASATSAAMNDAQLSKAVIEAMDNLEKDQGFQTAIGKNGAIKNGWNEVQALYNNGKTDARSVNAEISTYARMPATVVMELAEKYLRDKLSQNAPGKAHEPVLESIMKSTQGVNLSGFVIPDRLISTSAYIAFAYLSLSIWGMGFGAIMWACLFAFPEEWQLGGALTNGFRAGLGVVLAITLISIYLAAGLNFTKVKAEPLLTKVPTGVEQFWKDLKAQAAKIGGTLMTISPANQVATAAKVVGGAIAGGGVGAVDSILASFFTGLTLEQFMIGMLILTAPAQAALMLKGANGIGDHASKAIHANGAANQGLMGMAGMQGGSSGANAGGGFSASSIMGGRESVASRKAMFEPSIIGKQ